MEPRAKTIYEGDDVSFLCRASGDLIFGLEWLEVTGNSRIRTDSYGRLSFTSAR